MNRLGCAGTHQTFLQRGMSFLFITARAATIIGRSMAQLAEPLTIRGICRRFRAGSSPASVHHTGSPSVV